MTSTLGIDVGGANLKAADLDGNVRTAAFPVWQRHGELTDQLRSLSWIEHPDLVGVVMTAELADCFKCKADGVSWVIDSVQHAFPRSEVRIWLTTGEFTEPDDAVLLPNLVAAANWHALATWAGRAVPDGPAILIDIGSTTTDIIPILDGVPMTSGLTDLERLQFGELIYSGVQRTPLCAVNQSVVLAETEIPVAAEWFATTLDVYTTLGLIPEDHSHTDTADGRPSTVNDARRRIARMLCCDRSELSDETIDQIAQQFADTQRRQLIRGLQRIRTAQRKQLHAAGCHQADDEPQIVLSGSGIFLASKVAASCGLSRTLNLSDSASPAVAEAASAFAIARLVFERCRVELLETVSLHETGTQAVEDAR